MTGLVLSLRPPEACGDCAARLEEALAEHEGVMRVERSPGADRVHVELDPRQCSKGCLEDALDRARGALSSRYAHLRMTVEGMDCGGCARTITRAVRRLPGVTGVDVSFATGQVVVEHQPEGFDRGAAVRRIERLGYRPAREETLDARGAAMPARLNREHTTVAATALLLVAAVLDLAGTSQAAWLYGAAVAVGIGPIARGGLVAAWTTRRPEIRFLMTIACIGAIAIGAWMEAALVVVLFSLGEHLESRAVARARRELAGLVNLAPERARLLGSNGGEVEVEVSTLRVGDAVAVRPGERLPADGTVLEGRSAVDQAPITGESIPVDREVGDRVFAGTLNGQGRLIVTVGAAPGDTTLARIGKLVAEAQARRSPSERWVDGFARVYTPLVLGLALVVATALPLIFGASFEESFYSALALLILACPCALVLSTPVTIVSALGRASSAGVLVKGGEQLERAASVDRVVFDKTGTLTQGRPQVVSVVPVACTADQVLALAAALEQGSEHPLAAAIVAAARERGLPLVRLENFEAHAGFGATGCVGGRNVAVGKPAFFPPGTLSTPVLEALAGAQAAGHTGVVVAEDRRPVGVLALADPPRPEAREAVGALARLGIERVAMITGDNAATADAVAAAVGVSEVHAGALPHEKAELVAELGGNVAMVGDGINDAPALAVASLGVAMGSAGSDTAMEVADAALMGDDPSKVAGLIGLARWTRATVRTNIAFSLATKLLAAALLAFGWLPLWGAVVADVGASLVVVLLGLRLLIATPRGRLQGLPMLPSARTR